MNQFEDRDILTKTAQLLDLPMDVVAGLPNLELLGNRQLFLSQHRGLWPTVILPLTSTAARCWCACGGRACSFCP